MTLKKYFGGGKTEQQPQPGNAKSNKDDFIIDSNLEDNAVNEALDDDFISDDDHENTDVYKALQEEATFSDDEVSRAISESDGSEYAPSSAEDVLIRDESNEIRALEAELKLLQKACLSYPQ